MKLYYIQKFFNDIPLDIIQAVAKDIYDNLPIEHKFTKENRPSVYWKCYRIEKLQFARRKK